MAKLNHTPLSTRPGSLKGLWFLLGLMALLTSCATTEIVTTTSEPAMVAQVPIEDALRLDVMILPFDPNLERIEAVESDIPISAEVRRAESRYQAYHLKETLEQTGNWGVVRVIPSPTNFQPLLVQAKILASDGENLRLFVKATDAAGSVWINKEYSDSASKYAYQSVREDPFQDIYNQVANDLLKAHQARNASSIINIQNVARLKFAADLSPESVSNYLQTDRRGRVTVTHYLQRTTSLCCE